MLPIRHDPAVLSPAALPYFSLYARSAGNGAADNAGAKVIMLMHANGERDSNDGKLEKYCVIRGKVLARAN